MLDLGEPKSLFSKTTVSVCLSMCPTDKHISTPVLTYDQWGFSGKHRTTNHIYLISEAGSGVRHTGTVVSTYDLWGFNGKHTATIYI